DWNVPILGSEQMYQAMKTLGRTTELVVYPGEYHNLTVPSHLKDRMERFVAWYNHYVKGDSAPARPAQPEITTAGGERYAAAATRFLGRWRLSFDFASRCVLNKPSALARLRPRPGKKLWAILKFRPVSTRQQIFR